MILRYAITETHDIAEARDILEAIIANDRADVPAVTQRRQLAEQDRQAPRLQPRCKIPGWFDDLRREAASDYRDADEHSKTPKRNDSGYWMRSRLQNDSSWQRAPRVNHSTPLSTRPAAS